MSTFAAETSRRPRPSREEGLAIAEQRKAERRRRTSRIRKTIAVLAVALFVGPFGVIYQQMAAGKDPTLASTHTVAASTSTPATSPTTTSTPTPAPVTTSQS